MSVRVDSGSKHIGKQNTQMKFYNGAQWEVSVVLSQNDFSKMAWARF